MKKYFIPLIILMLLFGCTGSKPHLSVSFLPAPSVQHHEGDEVTIGVNVANTGQTEAKDFSVEILVGNVSLSTQVMTLQPNSNQTVFASWFPYSGGDYNVVAKVDSGNLVSDASADKEASMSVSVLPAKEESIFSAVPPGKLQNVAIINATTEGISSLYTYLPTMQDLLNPTYAAFLRPYLRSLKELHIGTLDYANGRHAVIIFIRGPTSAEQMSSMLTSLIKLETGLDSTVQNKTINGSAIRIINSDALPAPVCIWREDGWMKLTSYIDPIALETCSSMFGSYDPSYAEDSLSIGNEFARVPPFNASLLGATLHLANLTNISKSDYGAAFDDNEGFYVYYTTKEQNISLNNTCFGRISNRSSMQVCETPPINSTWAAVQRKVGNYSIVCLSSAKTGQLTISVEQKAFDLCYSLNYPGKEGMWVSILSLLHQQRCELPDGFNCLSYNFSNAMLQVNLTQNTGKTVVLNGFGCSSQANASEKYFPLLQPVTLPSNSSVVLNSPCYDEAGGTVQMTYTYFDTKLYLNYSIQGSNEPKVVVGNLTIRNV
jgi:hypothetical protein